MSPMWRPAKTKKRRHHSASPKPLKARRHRDETILCLEILEDRTLPSTVTWINSGGGVLGYSE